MEEAPRYTSVDVEHAGNLVADEGYVIVDVRTPEEFTAGHAPGAMNIPFMVQSEDGRVHNPNFVQQVKDSFPDASKPKMIVSCAGGTRGTSAATAIGEAGYDSVLCMPGGMKAWKVRGLPMADDAGAP